MAAQALGCGTELDIVRVDDSVITTEMGVCGRSQVGESVVELRSHPSALNSDGKTPASTEKLMPRHSHALAYDGVRHKVVLFGGFGRDVGDNLFLNIRNEQMRKRLREHATRYYGDTWELGGGKWTRVNSEGPSPRASHAMAFDAARRVTVLFGGDLQTSKGDTWVWDGDKWQEFQVKGPPSRSCHAMAYVPNRKCIVLFGGIQKVNNIVKEHFADTWEWNGNKWALVSTTGPSERSSHAMAFDMSRGRIILFGGQTADETSDETWEWDGSSWKRIKTSSSPPARFSHGMALDSARQRVVLFGGVGKVVQQSRLYLGDTWEWDGREWGLVSKGASGGRANCSMAYNASKGIIIVFGGSSAGSSFFSNDTWCWNGKVWRRYLKK